MAGEVTISDGSFHFINENINECYALQLILFFVDHPYAQFSELAIIHALNHDSGRRYLQKALKTLVDKGMIKTRTDSNVPFYSLPENMQNLVSELQKLNVCQRQSLLR